MLRVAEVLWETEAEGPGRRAAIWLQGCPLRCPGCCNPEMLPFEGGEPWSPVELVARVVAEAAPRKLEGISLLGGEPFAQAAGAAQLAAGVRAQGLSVMIFSGYTHGVLRRRAKGEPSVAALLAACDLLVDGPYLEAQHDLTRRWIGSRNQHLLFLSERYQGDDARFAAENTVELRLGPEGLIVNGWPGGADEVLS